MSIDLMVRETLRSHADEAPDGVGLLDAVRRRSRHRRVRRSVVLAGALALGVAGVPGLLHRVVVDPFVTPAAAVELVPPDYELPAFPFTPGWTPPGMQEPSISFGDSGMSMVYPRLHPGEPLSVSVSKTEPSYLTAKLGATSEELTTVRSRPAMLLRADDRPERVVVLTWQEASGLWVAVIGSYPLDADAVRRYSEALTAQPVPVRPPFTFDLVPRDAVPLGGGPWHMQLVPAVDDPGKVTGSVTVGLVAAERHPEATRTTVGGRDAEVLVDRSDGDVLTRVYIHLDARRMLEVGASGTLNMSRETMLRFAAGIHVTPDARLNG